MEHSSLGLSLESKKQEGEGREGERETEGWLSGDGYALKYLPWSTVSPEAYLQN